MAIVTGFTAERMLQIENETIVDANLVGDHLILVTREGTVIDVGEVKGEKGDRGDTPSLADLGVTASPAELNYTDGVTSAIQEQLNVKSDTGHTHDDRYFTETEVTSLLAGKSSSGHGHVFGDLATPTELGNAVDFNTLTTPGDYTQSTNAEAATATNAPCPYAGFLRVRNNAGGANNMVWQEYLPYQAQSTIKYWRTLYQSTWSPWSSDVSREGLGALMPRFRGVITATRNLASGTNTINNWTKLYDTSDGETAFNATTGLYTIPISGVYTYGLAGNCSSGSTRRFIQVSVPTRTPSIQIRDEGPDTSYSAMSFQVEDYFTAGEVLTPEIYAASAITNGLQAVATPAVFWARRVAD